MSETLQNPVLEKDENGREILLKVKDLAVTFYNGKKEFKAVHDVNFNVYKGETFSLVGESGSGKSVTCKTIMGILDSNGIIDSGEITLFYKDENGNEKTADLTKMSQKQIRYEFCGRKIAMVFQDPMTSLNPTMKIGDQIAESILIHRQISKEEAYKEGKR